MGLLQKAGVSDCRIRQAGLAKIAAGIAGFRVEADEQFADEGHADQFSVCRLAQPPVAVGKVKIVSPRHVGDDDEDKLDAAVAGEGAIVRPTLAAQPA
jgi:hypothetical protein